MSAHLDHIVIAAPDLASLVGWFAVRTGVVAQPGGRHPTGTQNALVALTVGGQRGPQYIELIGPYDDAGDAPRPTKFGIDKLTGPTVQTFAVRPADIDRAVHDALAVGWDTGPVGDLSRNTPEGELLQWRLTQQPTEAPARFDVPFLIDWGATRHPGETVAPALELVEFARLEQTAEQAEALRRKYAAVGTDHIEVRVAERAGYLLKLRTASGETVEFRP